VFHDMVGVIVELEPGVARLLGDRVRPVPPPLRPAPPAKPPRAPELFDERPKSKSA
jgi:hypothetical protein